MPEALRILHDELPNVDVMTSSQYSPLLADGLSKGKIDAAFLRRERGVPDLAFRLLVKEPPMVVLRRDHRLAALKSIGSRDLVSETLLSGLANFKVERRRVTPTCMRVGKHSVESRMLGFIAIDQINPETSAAVEFHSPSLIAIRAVDVSSWKNKFLRNVP
jgi:DNA-binding transcriptional LysR family regulator